MTPILHLIGDFSSADPLAETSASGTRRNTDYGMQPLRRMTNSTGSPFMPQLQLHERPIWPPCEFSLQNQREQLSHVMRKESPETMHNAPMIDECSQTRSSSPHAESHFWAKHKWLAAL
jgi:hypothetical protein